MTNNYEKLIIIIAVIYFSFQVYDRIGNFKNRINEGIIYVKQVEDMNVKLQKRLQYVEKVNIELNNTLSMIKKLYPNDDRLPFTTDDLQKPKEKVK